MHATGSCYTGIEWGGTEVGRCETGVIYVTQPFV